MFSICLFRREPNGTIAYRSTFRIVYLVDAFFGTERFSLKCSRLNATLQHYTFQNNTEQCGTIVFPTCERGLRVRMVVGAAGMWACAPPHLSQIYMQRDPSSFDELSIFVAVSLTICESCLLNAIYIQISKCLT